MKNITLLTVSMIAVLTILPVGACAQPEYRAVKITHNGESVTAYGELEINDNNHVLIPQSNFSTTEVLSHVWDGDSLIPITTATTYNIIASYGLNNSGQSTGNSRQNDPWHQHAFITENYTLTADLPPLPPAHEPPSCRGSFGRDINNLGQVVGYCTLPDSGNFATAWFDGSPTYLGVVPEHRPINETDTYGSWGYGISDNGKVVGISGLTTTEPVKTPLGFIWESGTMTAIQPFSGGQKTNARAVNDLGQVVGSAWGETEDYQYEHAYIWQNGSKQDIHGTLFPHSSYSEAWDINESGQVVGAYKASNNLAIAAFLYTDGTIYNLNDHIINETFPSDGTVVPNLDIAFSINESGNIVAVYGLPSNPQACLLTPVIEGYVVNSTSDAPDNNLGDGICDTGGPLVNGEPECSFRAAIQQSNAEAGKETISFNIPGGIPEIAVDSTLPWVEDSAIIDATTQPVSGRVKVDGSNLTEGSGLTVSAGNSTIKGLIISNFPGHGISILGGGNNELYGNVIGVDTTLPGLKSFGGNGGDGIAITGSSGNRIGDLNDSDANIIVGNTGDGIGLHGDSNTVLGNVIADNGLSIDTLADSGHGIAISGSKNKIGGAEPSGANEIVGNAGAGVYVTTGTGNTIRRNILYDNLGLGIDLASEGVNENDTLDADAGTNLSQNFPVIDSVVDFGSHRTVYGYLVSIPNHSFILEYYVSRSCDPSGYGEGEESVWTSILATDGDGYSEFEADISSFDPDSQYLTLTATDLDGNTSEFSQCWPNKELLILDVNRNPIAAKEFLLYRVANDPPTFTETLIDTVITDSAGIIKVIDSEIKPGDSVKVYRHLYSEPSPKGDILRPGTAYSVHLDNAKFDSLDHHMYFTEIDSTRRQELVMDHTTLAFNLMIAIEWVTNSTYRNGIQEAVRQSSNYLYDVTDGHVRLDTVYVADGGLNWEDADVWIRANNMEWPRATVFGIHQDIYWSKLRMPRKFYGNDDNNRNLSAYEIPLDPNSIKNARTLAHELGHYALGFYDEYLFDGGGGQCPYIVNYGFMDSHFSASGPSSSEMSWSRMYEQSECRNTNQYYRHAASCWNFFESTNQLTYDGIPAPIIRPDERFLNGSDYFDGPNDDAGSLDYDVGALVHFETNFATASALSMIVNVCSSFNDEPLGNVEVISYRPNYLSAMRQGFTSDSGRIVALGTRLGDTILVAGPGYIASIEKQGAQRGWFSGSAEIGGSGISKFGNEYRTSLSTDSIDMILSPVQGEYPVVANLDWSGTDLDLDIATAQGFPQTPSLQFLPDSGGIADLTLQSTADGYAASVEDVQSIGTFRVQAVDDSADAFFFDLTCQSSDVDGAGDVNDLFGGESDPSLSLDTSITEIERVTILSTEYPIIRTGLPDGAIQGGQTHTIDFYPQVNLGSDNEITIRYAEHDLIGPDKLAADETNLRIYRWNDQALKWNEIGGAVDTAENLVSAPMTVEGVYAAFVEESPTDADEIDGEAALPDRIDLQQNYPNPFNPSTTIRFHLSRSAEVTIEIYNILGQRIATVTDGEIPAGDHSVVWDGTDDAGDAVASGVYFYRLTTDDYTETKKMLLLK